MLLDTQGGD